MVHKDHGELVARLFEHIKEPLVSVISKTSKNHRFQLFQNLKEPLVLVISKPSKKSLGFGYFKTLKEITRSWVFQNPQRTTGLGYFKTLKEPLVLVISKPSKNHWSWLFQNPQRTGACHKRNQ
jgi:hypothetical protein